LLLFLIFILRVDVVQGALATISIFGRSLPSVGVENLVEQTQSVIAMVLYFAGTALAVFASAGLVSAMFEPGRIELLLSKPVSRVHLLLGRYAGNVLVVSANILYLVFGCWIVFGIKTGVWGTGFPLSSLCTIFVFCVLLSVIVLVGVLWDSAAVAIMVTFAIMIITPILAQRFAIERLLSSEWSRQVVRILYYALPKISDISVIIRRMILNEPIESWMPIWSTAIFGVVVLGIGVLRFRRRSF
jgi:ABC-type transport system involved in multi-copper enzyme maturation permease subunit